MAERLNSYLAFADNDYLFFRQVYDTGNKGSALAALGQSICERYLKHVISEFAQPENRNEMQDKENILRTHSLRRLMRYIQEDMDLEIPEKSEMAMDRIDGFYFTTRYPGSESFIPSERDIDKANTAVEEARKFTMNICEKFQ
nr:HEPN domain-containing protein [uncultured Blautia sp.]